MIYSRIVGTLWVAFFLYWLVTGLGAKRARNAFAMRLPISAVVVALVLLFVRSRPADINANAIRVGPTVRAVGVLLCVAGMGFAAWARHHLGKNWGMPMAVHESPELITTGPYTRLRHPIYTGILIALIGNALVLSLWWFAAVVAGLLYFGYASVREERTLLETFPRDYAEYQRRSKRIIPGIF